jgi:polyisoprenoid-binding protein YceI
MFRPAALALLALPAALVVAVPALTAQDRPAPTVPGTADASRVAAGTYTADAGHTLVGFRVSHFGFNDYFGQFGNITGTLVLDPANPAAAALDITIPVSGLATASAGLTAHMQRADFFDMPNHANVRFVSTAVVVDGTTARITGNLTIRGVTRPVTLAARFVGAGTNPFNRKPTIGFHATTTINRSDFGMTYGVPVISDAVQLDISASFEAPAPAQ